MKYVMRQINPPGKSAFALDHTAAELAAAAVKNTLRVGLYLAWSDPNARCGLGDEKWTPEVRLAKRFKSFEEAMTCWKAQSRLVPLRSDGKPNRPLTAFSVTIEKVIE